MHASSDMLASYDKENAEVMLLEAQLKTRQLALRKLTAEKKAAEAEQLDWKRAKADQDIMAARDKRAELREKVRPLLLLLWRFCCCCC